MALAVGRRALPRYGHRFSRHDFTLPQLFAILVLRQFTRNDYRGIVATLIDWPTLCGDMQLHKVPHFTTLQKAERRLLRDALIRRMLAQTVALLHRHPDTSLETSPLIAEAIERAAADSTGFELDGASRYFVRRKARSPGLYQTTTYRRFGKLGVVADCDNHLILGTHATMGPRPDVDQLLPLMGGMCVNAVPQRLIADAGYDSEPNHILLREYLNITSLIPATAGRPTLKLPTGKWRYLMATDFDDETYGQRWQVETVMFMLKRHFGSALTSRKYQTRRREMNLRAVTHNLMILLPAELFYRAGQNMIRRICGNLRGSYRGALDPPRAAGRRCRDLKD